MVDVDIDDVLEWSEKIANVIGNLLSMLLIVQMIGDLLGISVFEAIRIIITRPWIIPIEWIRQYYWLWYSLEWILLMIMLGDQVYTMRYMQTHKHPPPPSYERWVSFATFMISFWLAIILRYMTFTLICIFSAISFSYTMFIRKE